MADLENSNILAKWLEGTLSKEEELELLSSDNLEDLKFVIDDIDTWKLPERNTSELLKELKSKIEQKKKRSRVIQMRRWISVAASVLLLLGVYFVYKTAFTPQMVHLETAFNESIDHQLPDGSMIAMDGSTSIDYNQSDWSKERKVNLQGQALFDVQSGAPFVVKTSYGSIEVLGTQFNVESGDQFLEVSCYKGLVKVNSQNKTVKLSLGNGVIFDHGTMTEFNVKTEQPDWKIGYTEFENAPLTEVITSLNNRFDSHVKLPVDYENQRFTGRFMNNDFEKAIKMIFDPIGISYTLGENNEVHF